LKEPHFLEMRDIKKKFGKVQAVVSADLIVKEGEIHALMGENGAGKSTLMNVLSGSVKPTSGYIYLFGKEVQIDNPHIAKKYGIAKIHQELQLVPEMTAAENIFLGREILKKNGLIDFNSMNKQSIELFKDVDLHVDPKTKVKDLRVGEQQLLEIIKAISLDAKIIIMDEPTSALSKKESQKLFKVVKKLSAENVSIIYITHRMEEVFELTDRITVMRDGKYINTIVTSETSKDELVKLMVGRTIDTIENRDKTISNKKILEVKNISLNMKKSIYKRSLKDISLSLYKGEILGIAGLMGAGRTEFFESLFGIHPNAVSGQIYIDSKKVSINSPIDAINNGMAFVTENRKDEGLVLGRSIGENISLPLIKKFSKYFFMEKSREKTEWDILMDRLKIKAPSSYEISGNLSGGNQQKVVLARWLLTKPKILLLDEPTRGIDVAAREEIYALMHKLVESGIGIIVISSELPEIINVSDRILTFCEGRITGEFTRQDVTQEKILDAATKREVS